MAVLCIFSFHNRINAVKSSLNFLIFFFFVFKVNQIDEFSKIYRLKGLESLKLFITLHCNIILTTNEGASLIEGYRQTKVGITAHKKFIFQRLRRYYKMAPKKKKKTKPLSHSRRDGDGHQNLIP